MFDFTKLNTQQLNLDSKLGREVCETLNDHFDYSTPYELDLLLRNACVGRFVETGETSLWYERQPVVISEADEFYVINKNVVHGVQRIPALLKDFDFNRDIPAAVLVPKGKKGYLCLINGDEDNVICPQYPLREDDFQYFIGSKRVKKKEIGERLVTISFQCLQRFYEPLTTTDVARMVGAGRLEVVDYTRDVYTDIKGNDLRKLRRWHENKGDKTPCPLRPPEKGFTLISERWHRPATVLFRDTKKNFSILLGQDEEIYFGVELADNPKTIDDAYLSLMPPAAREQDDWQRQGEWFAIPRKTPPKTEEFVLHFDEQMYVSLFRESDESAKHQLYANEGGVLQGGIVCALDPALEHSNDEHKTLNLSGWHEFHRNTARRSFSVKGVD